MLSTPLMRPLKPPKGDFHFQHIGGGFVTFRLIPGFNQRRQLQGEQKWHALYGKFNRPCFRSSRTGPSSPVRPVRNEWILMAHLPPPWRYLKRAGISQLCFPNFKCFIWNESSWFPETPALRMREEWRKKEKKKKSHTLCFIPERRGQIWWWL